MAFRNVGSAGALLRQRRAISLGLRTRRGLGAPLDHQAEGMGRFVTMRASSLLAATLSLAFLTGAPMPRGRMTATAAPGVTQPHCSRVSLTPRPAWLSDAMWLPGPGKILAVDAAMERLVAYSPDGKGTIVPEPAGEQPVLLAASGGRILLELIGRDVVRLDGELGDRKASSFLKHVATPLGPLGTVNQWTAVDGSVVVFGQVVGRKVRPVWRSGLFRISTTDGSHQAELLLKVQSGDYYILGYRYLTSLGRTAFFLDMDHGVAKLFAVRPGARPRELKGAVPPEIRDVPPIDASMPGPADAPALFAALARLKLAAGIYGGPVGSLYLLGREPKPRGGTDWWLFRIDAETGALAGKALLPTRAQHLSIVTSAESFYLIERGPVNPYGGQEIDTMVAVPVTLLEQAAPEGTEVCTALRR